MRTSFIERRAAYGGFEGGTGLRIPLSLALTGFALLLRRLGECLQTLPVKRELSQTRYVDANAGSSRKQSSRQILAWMPRWLAIRTACKQPTSQSIY